MAVSRVRGRPEQMARSNLAAASRRDMREAFAPLRGERHQAGVRRACAIGSHIFGLGVAHEENPAPDRAVKGQFHRSPEERNSDG